MYGFLHDSQFENTINNVSHMLPIKGGKVINLKTSEVRDRTRDDKYTFECPVSYVADIKNADKFFTDVMPKEEQREYLRKCLGYIITGEVDARCFFVWYGNGSNGKSVIINLLKKIMKDFYVSTSKGVFCKMNDKSSGAPSPDVYALLNKRVLSYSEGDTSDNFELNFTLLKQISGDDEISCRALYKDQITFNSIGKLIFASNYIPPLSNEDAVRQRNRVIYFEEEFVDNPLGKQKKKDSHFVEQLETIYLDEIFSWIVKGSQEFYKDRKIIMPESFAKKTKEFVEQEDSIASYFTHVLEFTDNKKDSIKKSSLFENFKQ
jgi:putative DNA primase/helicase